MASPTPNDTTALKSRIKASYDAIAGTYNAALGPTPHGPREAYSKRLLSLLQQASPRDPSQPVTRILELGCGAGLSGTQTLLAHPSSPPVHVTANDISSTQLALARRNLADYLACGRLELVEADMMTLAFPPDSFDAVTGFFSIIHLPRDEQTQLMRRIGEWVRPGGFFLANFAEAEGERIEAEKWLGEEGGWMFWSAWGVEGSLKMVEEAGFEVLEREVRDSEREEARFLWVVAKKAG